MPARDISVLATVGSTSFDGLIESLIADRALEVLYSAGVRKLLLQYGRGQPVSGQTFTPASNAGEKPLVVNAIAFAPSLAQHIAAADIVATHCGAGCVFESLAARKHVVAVPNRSLMDDHQSELADELDERGALRVAEVGTDLPHVVALACRDVRMGVVPPGDSACPRNSSLFANIIDEEVHENCKR